MQSNDAVERKVMASPTCEEQRLDEDMLAIPWVCEELASNFSISRNSASSTTQLALAVP